MHFKQLSLLCTLSSFLFSAVLTFNFNRDGDHKERSLPFLSGNRPRISIFSKPADKEANKTTGLDIVGHATNVMQGGSIGVELDMNPASGVQGIFDAAKKIIPGVPTHPQEGRPETQKPPSDLHDPNNEPHQKPKDPKDEHHDPKDDPHHEEEKDYFNEDNVDYEKPDKLTPDVPSWDDIGEDPEDDPAIPYEELIDPRKKPQSRSKRAYYSNSKIIRIPLQFRSNAKPFQVRFFNMVSKDRQEMKNINGLLRK